ncbi:hypothetical protein [Aequorivita sp. CIP111184]|uniref:hypothetical protein n=1 Tax=Aequorivita sp. CIP111184 TaxID=2211356 RepID=UPI000DBC1B14|nr:hypothetical protein [Aequorivita sp. CIP111184]SRX55987.1 hypothetical protein AEQU1_03013 [Aequorivita sp. CIP111184]
MKNKILIVLSCLVILSCNKNDECESIQPSQPIAFISIIDGDGVSLIGEDNVYKPSEISLEKDGQQISAIDFFEDESIGITVIQIYFDLLESGQDYMLKLNSEETDILNIDIARNDGFCFDTYEIEKFQVNGQAIQPDLNTYVIQK